MKSVLLHYAQACKEKPNNNEIMYDHYQAMSMIDNGSEIKPFIEYSKNMMALMTKTESAIERDDAFVEIMALQTKTFTQTEHDDQDFAYYQ